MNSAIITYQNLSVNRYIAKGRCKCFMGMNYCNIRFIVAIVHMSPVNYKSCKIVERALKTNFVLSRHTVLAI